MPDIHDNIFTYRKNNKMSMETLGKAIGVSKQTIQRYESREIKNIPYDKIVAIANVFNITPTELMGWDDTPITIDFSVPVPVENKYIDMYQELKQEDKDIINRLIETLYNAR